MNDDNGNTLPGWQMMLHAGGGCTGPVLQSGVTNSNGLVDFEGLSPGTYSVEEVLQPGWTPVSPVCEDVTLTANRSSGLAPGLDYPGMGNDNFPSGASVTIDIPGSGSYNVTLNGPTAIHRSDPCVGCDSGRTTIATEMLQMDLTGNSSVFGPVHLRESPSRPSLGQIRQQSPGMDFPADSFFDIFFEIDTSGGTLHNEQPVHMQSVIDAIPSINSPYTSHPQPPIALLTSSGQPVAFLRSAAHVALGIGEIIVIKINHQTTPTPTPTPTPPPHSITVIKLNDDNGNTLPGWQMNLYAGGGCSGPVLQSGVTNSNGLVDFEGLTPGTYSVSEVLQAGWTPVSPVCEDVTLTANRSSGSASGRDYPGMGNDNFPSGASVTIDIPGSGSYNVTLNGPTAIHRNDPCVGCGPGGRTTIDTEMLQMDLTGNSSVFGPVHLRESPSRPSLGQIRQQSPGVDFPADSFFDVFVEIDTNGGTLHNEQPVHMQSVIDAIPPINDPYIDTSGQIPLFNSSGQPVGFLRNAAHVALGIGEIIVIKINHQTTPTPTPTPTPPPHSITVIKLNDDNGNTLPGWQMNLYAGGGCTGPVLQSGVTNSNGLVDFEGLTPGTYSVEEVLQPGWTPVSPVCEDVTLTANRSSGLVPGRDYPGMGNDNFPSGASVTIDIPGSGSYNVTLNGPTAIHRSDPCVGCGPGGRTTIDTEMLQMDLTGNSSVFGPVHLRESPSRPSLGQIRQQSPGVDFPADSFFDVFVEIDTSVGPLHNEQPVHMQSVIDAIPPINDPYIDTSGQIPLFNSSGQPVGFLRNAAHVALGIGEIIVIKINHPTPTPTPTPTPPNPTPTPHSPTPNPTETPPSTPSPTATATATATVVPTSTPSPTVPVLDHFKAYVTDGLPLNVQILLQDQFDSGPVPFVVDRPFRFANPVKKTHSGVVTPITNPDTHLEMYRIFSPILGTTRYVDVNNQFGMQTLTVEDAVLLGVPTQKNYNGQIGGPPHDVDHFKFYNATGNPVNAVVDLLDQFHFEPNVPVLRPRYFANPVEKMHNGVITPITHPHDFLVCYDIGPQTFNASVTTLNQFGSGTLPIHPADLLCVPSQKLSFVEVTPTPAPTATPTPPSMVSISGSVIYCANSDPVSGVTMSLTGPSPAPSSTPTDSSGNYMLSNLTPGGTYTVTPSKAARAPGSTGINTVDVVAVQRHFLNITLLPPGCGLTAADVNRDTLITTTDVIAIQRFAIGLSSGIANTGQYQFTPAARTYPVVVSDQTGQNYNTLVLGDVVSPFAERAGGPSQDAAEVAATVAAVALPEVAVAPSRSNFIAAVRSTEIDSKNKLVGFQGDFTFDERVVTFQSEPVQNAGLTAGNWNVLGNVLPVQPGAGPIRTLRISAYSTDLTPLSGSGTLFELRMTRVSKGAQSTQLIWAAAPNQFIFIDADLKTQKPGYSASGGVNVSGGTPVKPAAPKAALARTIAPLDVIDENGTEGNSESFREQGGILFSLLQRTTPWEPWQRIRLD